MRSLTIAIALTHPPSQLTTTMKKHISEVIVYKNQNRKSGARVTLGFTALFNMGMTDSVRTDSNGVARIHHDSEGHANIFVDGSKVGEDRFPNRVIVYL